MPRDAVTVDMRERDPATLIVGALDTLVFGGDRTLRIVGDERRQPERVVEVLMPERAAAGRAARLLAQHLSFSR